MLYEIICDKFIQNGQPRGPIRFHNGLNVVKGHDSGQNSIGKSTFLLAIDFAFGGSVYAEEKKLINQIGHHTIKFCFVFDNVYYYFSRNTEDKKKVSICDENYNVTQTISLEEYCEKLKTLYKIDIPYISFRDIVGRYFRIYRRDSSDERQPLASFAGEPESKSLISFLKLFDGYKDIIPIEKKKKDKEDHKSAINDAAKFNLVKVITKKADYKANEEEIEKLNVELENITNHGRQDILSLDPKQAETAASLKAEYDKLNRIRKQLWVNYYQVKANLEASRPMATQDFEKLLRYFPNSNIKLFSDIENFHAKLTDILKSEFVSSRDKILEDINSISKQMEALQQQLKEYDLPQRVAKTTLDAYSQIQSKLKELRKTNELYNEKKQIEADIKEIKKEYETKFKELYESISVLINEVVEELDTYIYGAGVVHPYFKVNKSNSYVYETPNDDGTGTNNKNLILLDVASLKKTPLPVVSHDTIVFKHIGQKPMAKILEIYKNLTKQVFIAIDETVKYAVSAQGIIDSNMVLQLSAGGNELFGSSWVERKKDEDKEDETE